MGRHSENSSDLIYLKFPCLQKLCFVRRNGNRSIFHALFQDGNLVAVGRTAEGRVPGVTHPCRVFQCSRMLQHTTWCCSVGVELTAVLLRCDCQADGILRHRNGAVTNKPVKTQSRNMKHIGRVKDDRPGFHRWSIIVGLRVFVIQMSVLVPIHCHAVRHQGIERNDLALAYGPYDCAGL